MHSPSYWNSSPIHQLIHFKLLPILPFYHFSSFQETKREGGKVFKETSSPTNTHLFHQAHISFSWHQALRQYQNAWLSHKLKCSPSHSAVIFFFWRQTRTRVKITIPITIYYLCIKDTLDHFISVS